MKEKILVSWRQDKLYTALLGCWLATVLASFFGIYLLPITIPIVGTIYAFRVLLPIAVVLYLIWAVRNGESLWRGVSTLEKWCDIFGAILLIYGAVSLFRAVEFSWTFRRLFNLTYDLFFFWMVIRMLRIPIARKWTMNICAVMLGILVVLGLYEVFFGGIVDSKYDDYQRVRFFNEVLQYPVVFDGNTNDFSATLLYLFSALLLWWLQPGKIEGRPKAVLLALLGMFSYIIPLISESQLCSAGVKILTIGLLLWLFIGKHKGRAIIPLLLIVGILFTEFSGRYYYLKPQVDAYFQALQSETSNNNETNTTIIQLQKPNQESLQDQFLEINSETGETQLRQDGSAGVRARLLIHAGQCFVESYGLGVGLGNTEVLAKERAITQNGIWSIHCFIVRLIADYGIFALIPLCIIAALLLKRVALLLLQACRQHNKEMIGYALLAFCVLLLYPFVSTASSDAQDSLTMWLYLGTIVVLSQSTWKDVMGE